MTKKHLSSVRFDSFGLPSLVFEGIKAAGFEYCTDIQAMAFPALLQGADVLGQAQTGTGKSATFLIATANRLLTNENKPRANYQPLALIIAPTRELADQIYADAQILLSPTGLRSGVVYGGVGYDAQLKYFEEGIEILIGTPGRLIDLCKNGHFDLNAIEVLVLDEADRMFELGFIQDIRYLMRKMGDPIYRQSMMFSATMSFKVLELAYEHMNNPVKIDAQPDEVAVDKIDQTVYHPGNEEKLPLLIALFNQKQPSRAIVFVNTKHVATSVTDTLCANGWNAVMLTGDVAQHKRFTLLEDFKQGKVPVLVATDVAARGLHITGVSHVFNYDLPNESADYVHRIGRTARAGASGEAVSFACEEYGVNFVEIEALIQKKIPAVAVSSVELPEIIVPPRRHFEKRFNRSKGRSNRHSDHQ